MKKLNLVISLFLCLVFFSLVFFFSFSPDHLINFVPEDVDFYLHLNLHRFSYEGVKGLIWLNQFWPEEIFNKLRERDDNLSFLGINLNRNVLSLVNEIGLIVKDKEITLLFETRRENENLREPHR